MRNLSVLVVGNLDDVGAIELDGYFDGVASYAPTPEAASALLEEGEIAPELIVVAESRGGQFSAESLAALRKLAPLAGVWRLLGSWCEGETRSERPPAGCIRSYWHQWPQRWPREAGWAEQGHLPAWSLP